jgi:hypothetical protein
MNISYPRASCRNHPSLESDPPFGRGGLPGNCSGTALEVCGAMINNLLQASWHDCPPKTRCRHGTEDGFCPERCCFGRSRSDGLVVGEIAPER